MKTKFFATSVFLLLLCRNTFSQVDCPIPCCDQTFPYQFCPNDGTDGHNVRCSSDPNNDHNNNGESPKKPQYLPSKICFDNEMPEKGQWQAKAEPDRDAELNFTLPPTDPGDDPQAGIQRSIDVSDIFDGKEPTRPDPDDNIRFPGGESSKAYQDALKQFTKDHLFYMTNLINPRYVRVWDPARALIDAQEALDNWYALCEDPVLEKHEDCCLHIYFDDNWQNFDPGVAAHADSQPCDDAGCPNVRIRVNVSDKFLQRTLNANVSSDERYGLHHVAQATFFTGKTPPSGLPFKLFDGPELIGDYSTMSWYQLMEHEIGHYLGLRHPDEIVCHNNAALCKEEVEFTVMHQGKAALNQVPKELTADDECMFKKLWCNPCPTVGVYEGEGSGRMSMQLYPNPSNGVTYLKYYLAKESMVNITLYDLLGREIIKVLSQMQPLGSATVSLPTQHLVAGSYVCRVEVDSHKESLNFILTK